MVLNQYEQIIALDVVASEDIAVKFEGEVVDTSSVGDIN